MNCVGRLGTVSSSTPCPHDAYTEVSAVGDHDKPAQGVVTVCDRDTASLPSLRALDRFSVDTRVPTKDCSCALKSEVSEKYPSTARSRVLVLGTLGVGSPATGVGA